jgi:arylamine N-acetyltransferase
MAPVEPSIQIIGSDTVDPSFLDPFLHTAAVRAFERHFSIVPRPADLDFLGEILSHFSNFPYENLSKIIRHHEETDMVRKLRLPFEVMEGYIRGRLGGTCFSLTFFLETILIHAGYRCHPVMADMKWSPNSHCAIIVLHGGSRYLVDPGYLLNRPMEMTPEKPRIFDTEFAGVELANRPGTDEFDVYTFNRSETKWRYRFKDRPCPPGEFLIHWISSFSWNSMHGLCLTRSERGKLIYVHKQFMRESTYDGKRNSNIRQDYHRRIHEAFGIEPALVEQALSALEANMAREREQGLWKPKIKQDGTRITTDVSDSRGEK